MEKKFNNNIEQTDRVLEITGCYLYFLCDMVSKYAYQKYKVAIKEDDLPFADIIPARFKSSCKNTGMTINGKKNNNGEKIEVGFEKRFFCTVAKIVQKREQINKLKSLMIGDTRYMFKNFFEDDVCIDFNNVISVFCDYINNANQKILVAPTKELNAERNGSFELEGEKGVRPMYTYSRVYNEYLKEKNNINSQLTQLITGIGKTISGIIKPVYNPNQNQTLKNLGYSLFFNFNSFLVAHINMVKEKIMEQKICGLNKVKTIEQVEDYFKTYQIDYLPKQAIKRIIK